MSKKGELRKRWHVEPGATIRQQFIELNQALDKGHGRSSEELFVLLNGLPLREEVPNGRDLRGSDFGMGMELDLSNTDFSYATSTANFFSCDLTNARFDEAVSERSSFGSKLNGASFKKARLRGCYMMNAEAHNCCFDGAKLTDMNFQNSDLSGSSFQNANCDGATFLGANLTGCDFRGAILNEAQFQNAIIDTTTDLRGASLINASSDTRNSNDGSLFARGVDLRAATHDATTLFGSDPLAYEIKIAEQTSKLARKEYGADGAVISALLKVAATQIREGKVDTWEAETLAQLTAPQQELYQEILDEVFHRRLV